MCAVPPVDKIGTRLASTGGVWNTHLVQPSDHGETGFDPSLKLIKYKRTWEDWEESHRWYVEHHPPPFIWNIHDGIRRSSPKREGLVDTRFATLVYTQEECDARALPGAPLGSRARGAPATTGSSTAPGGEAGGGLTGGIFNNGGESRAEGGGQDDQEEEEEEEEEGARNVKAKGGKKESGKNKTPRKTAGAKEKSVRKEKSPRKATGVKAKDAAVGPTAARPKPRPKGKAAAIVTTTSPPDGAPPGCSNGDVPPNDDSPNNTPPNAPPSDDLHNDAPPDDPPTDAPPDNPPNDAPPDNPPNDVPPDNPPPDDLQRAPTPPPLEPTPPPPWQKWLQTKWSDELKRIWPWLEATGAAWGEVWVDCAYGLLSFEEASGFPVKRVRMPKTPRALWGLGLNGWIVMGRRLAFPPCISPPEKFRQEFWGWWKGLQPEERHIGDGDGAMSRAADIDWGVLRDYSGKHGLLHVLMVLAWWGETVHGEKGELRAEFVAEWTLVTEDVSWVLMEMVKEGWLSKKRAAKRGVFDSGGPPPSKKACTSLVCNFGALRMGSRGWSGLGKFQDAAAMPVGDGGVMAGDGALSVDGRCSATDGIPHRAVPRCRMFDVRLICTKGGYGGPEPEPQTGNYGARPKRVWRFSGPNHNLLPLLVATKLMVFLQCQLHKLTHLEMHMHSHHQFKSRVIIV
ncbi:hypothetical protein DFH09DRAFT_1287226 [Mycena vulgaris]|nr:hypothetical protein DFH09DRAFT_1287226 [Mycena vulgaris]